MRKIRSVIVNIFIPALIIGGLIIYLLENRSRLFAIADVSLLQIFYLVILILLTWATSNFQSILLLRGLGVNIKYFENFAALIAMALGNYLPGRVGSLIRMRFYKKRYGVEYSKFGGMIGLRIVILFVVAGVFGSVGLIGHGFFHSKYNMPLIACFLLMVLLSIASFLYPIRSKREADGKFGQIWHNFAKGFKAIRPDNRVFVVFVTLVILQLVFLAGRLYIVFQMMGIHISCWMLFIISPMATLLTVLNITPGSLGAREWVIGALSAVVGAPFQGGIFAGTLDRVVLMLCTFVFGSVSLLYIFYKMKD